MHTRLWYQTVLMRLALVVMTGLAVGWLRSAQADSVMIDFEAPLYILGNINGQDGWSKTGAYDVEVTTNPYGYTSFGS